MLGIAATFIGGLLVILTTNAINDSRQTAENARQALSQTQTLRDKIDNIPNQITLSIGGRLDRLADSLELASKRSENALPRTDANQLLNQVDAVNSQQWDAIRANTKELDEQANQINGLANQLGTISGQLNILINRTSMRQDNALLQDWDGIYEY